jgi:hypothetical protein
MYISNLFDTKVIKLTVIMETNIQDDVKNGTKFGINLNLTIIQFI